MKLKKEFITYKADGKLIVISTDTGLFSGMLRFNDTGAYIIDCLKEDTSLEKIIEKMLTEFNGSRELIEADVYKVVDTLKRINALED